MVTTAAALSLFVAASSPGVSFNIMLYGVGAPRVIPAEGQPMSGRVIAAGQGAFQIILYGSPYAVEFEAASGSPSTTVEVESYSGTEAAEWSSSRPLALYRWRDVSLPQDRTIRLSLGKSAILEVRGSWLDRIRGKPEWSAVPPTVHKEGGPLTTRGPLIQAHERSDPQQTVVTLEASSPVGVKDVYYSLDGHTYRLYQAPFSVSELTTVQVFADDTLANRSSGTFNVRSADAARGLPHAGCVRLKRWSLVGDSQHPSIRAEVMPGESVRLHLGVSQGTDAMWSPIGELDQEVHAGVPANIEIALKPWTRLDPARVMLSFICTPVGGPRSPQDAFAVEYWPDLDEERTAPGHYADALRPLPPPVTW